MEHRSNSVSSDSTIENGTLSPQTLNPNDNSLPVDVCSVDKLKSKSVIDIDEEIASKNKSKQLQNVDNQDDEIKEDPLLLSLLVEPDERQPSDIENIITYLNCIDACSQFSCNMLKAMAEVAILASTDSKDSSVWIKCAQTQKILETLTDGQCFGVIASREKQTHKNILVSATDNCQFLCVSKDDFCRIAEDSKLKLQEHLENSKVVMVTEHRSINKGERQGHVIIKATPKKLLENLIDRSFLVDPTYVEDFLICHRVFFKDFSETTAQLLEWLETPGTADKAVKIIILWINYCFEDFQDEPELVQFLSDFIAKLKMKNMKGPLRFIHIACTGRTAAKTVHYNNSSFEKGHFNDIKLVGGLGTSFGIYITKVTSGGDGFKSGLCEGDEIIVINKRSTETMTSAQVESLIASSKNITLSYKRCMTTKLIMQDQIDALSENFDTFTTAPRTTKHSQYSSNTVRSVSQLDAIHANSPDYSSANAETSSTGATAGRKKMKKFLRLKIFTRTLKTMAHETRTKANTISNRNNSYTNIDYIPVDALYNKNYSLSITQSRRFFDQLLDRSLAVSKVLKDDGTWKSIVFNENVTAADILKNFGENNENHALSCLTMDPGSFQTTDYTFQPQENCLQEFEHYNQRFYIKKLSSPNATAEQVINDIRKHISCNLIDLDASIVAKAISINNFDYFTKIKVKEYIYSIFENKDKEKYPNLNRFVERCNLELYWVINEILNEPTISGRAKIIEKFIKIAYICKELRNLNSVFFIISGLMHSAVKALTTSWEKVLPKFTKIYDNLQQLLDPSRNMMKYRALLNDKSRPTLIPIFPVLQKDLTFINDGNSTWNDDLINFEKLRMISKEIRSITQYYSCTFDYMQLFTSKEIHAFKVSHYLQIPFRPQYLMHEEESDHVPLSDLGMTNFSTKACNLYAEQTRLFSNFVTRHKYLVKEYLMEKRVFKYLKTRLSSLETTKVILVSRAKYTEANATMSTSHKKSVMNTNQPAAPDTKRPRSPIENSNDPIHSVVQPGSKTSTVTTTTLTVNHINNRSMENEGGLA